MGKRGSRKSKREQRPEPPRPEESRRAGCLRDLGNVALLLFCVGGFAAMILEPRVAVAWEAMLAAAAVAAPVFMLVMVIRFDEEHVVDLLLPLVATGSYAAVAINAAVKRGPDWRLGLTVLVCMLWLTLAGVVWARKR